MSFQIKKYREPSHSVGTVAELFAGVGGFRVGLAQAGWKTVFSNQWEPSTKRQHASEVYVARFGSEGHSNEDIATVEKLPNVDLLVGGFPCQDYSVAKSLGAAHGLRGKKGVLWWEILRLIRTNPPKFIFLENVDRLLKSPSNQRGRDFAVMLKTLSSEGYLVEWRVVNSADYGFPQRRIRVFIVARHIGSNLGLKKISPDDYLVRTGILARALPVGPLQDSLSQIDLQDDPEILSQKFGLNADKSPFRNSGLAYEGRAYTTTVDASYKGTKHTLEDVLIASENVPLEYLVDPSRIESWRFLKGSKTIQRVHKASGKTYNYAEGSMAFPDLITKPSRTILTAEGGSTPSRFKHIILGETGYRRLTPIELERLNGFPDNWTEFGCDGQIMSDTKRAFFMGNALVVGLIARVGKALAAEMQQSTKTLSRK